MASGRDAAFYALARAVQRSADGRKLNLHPMKGYVLMMHWLYLGIANVAEVAATSALKAAEGFTRFGPSVVVGLGYLVTFYFLSLTLRTILVGVVYAIWSGVGIVLISLIGWLVFGQSLDPPAIIGLGLIVCGVVLIHALSKSIVL
jgi:small multidrug resistance pump